MSDQRRLLPTLLAAVAASFGSALPAAAHVKWFAPYFVAEMPRPPIATLTDPSVWIAVALVVGAFAAAVLVERSPVGAVSLGLIDRATAPMARNCDVVVRAMSAAFFVALFAEGRVYLTPELVGAPDWVPWCQLAIAAAFASRQTLPLAAAGVLALWFAALRDYEVFHLVDYLALGVGFAGYLVLAARPDASVARHRFALFRWGVAVALMWSSIEKFAYPDWFHELVLAKPFLTMGMPEGVFVPMSGVAEFTIGFGLLWTPLVRRLSALSLLSFFALGTMSFGRVELIGHALILVGLAVVAAQPEGRPERPSARLAPALAAVPAMLVPALLVMGSLYFGLHAAFYGPGVPISASALCLRPAAADLI